MRKTSLKIGNITLNSCVVLAPMAGVTNGAYKKICRDVFTGLICSEMINDKGLLHQNEKTLQMSFVDEYEHPVSMQLFGSEVPTMKEAAIYLEQKTNCDIIDINMGCPAPKITKNNSGSKLLLYPERAYEIVKTIKEVTTKPLTIKMRIGYDENNINAVEFAKLMEKAGVDAIFIHGRTTKQQYRGKADWSIIKAVKETVSIPVIGNGDIDTPQKALAMIEYSGVDGVMIGRAAMGNPWLLNEIDYYLKENELLIHPTITEKKQTLIKHFDELSNLKNSKIAALEIRAQGCMYFKGLNNATEIKKTFQTISSREELLNVLEMIKE